MNGWGLMSVTPAQAPYGTAVDGVETMPRNTATATAGVAFGSSGAIRFSFFTAHQTVTVTKAVTVTGGTAAAATPTLCRVGLWEVNAAGDLTLVAATPNTTSLWSAANTMYETVLAAAYTVRAGQRYAAGGLCVTAGAVPTVKGYSAIAGGDANLFALAPRISATISGQSDLPASVAAGSLAAVNTFHWVGFTQ